MTQAPQEISERLEFLKRAVHSFKVDLEGANVKLEEVRSCLSDITDILELLSKTIVISDQMDLSYRHRILQDLETLTKTKDLLEKAATSLSKDNPIISEKLLEYISTQEEIIQEIFTSIKQNSVDLKIVLSYLRKLNSEDENGKNLTGFAWFSFHFSKGVQGAFAGIIIATIYYFLRYILPRIMDWQSVIK